MYATLSKKIVATDIKKTPKLQKNAQPGHIAFCFSARLDRLCISKFRSFYLVRIPIFFLVENFFPSPGFEPWIGRMKIAFDHSPDKPS